jgi:serine O-acetyltransferase
VGFLLKTEVKRLTCQVLAAFARQGWDMTSDADFDADLSRYPIRPFLKEQSIWAICTYRYGRRVLNRKRGSIRTLQLKFYWMMFRIVETLTGISLPVEARIGPGLRIYHFGNIFIHSRSVIGRNCTLRQGVTIGNRSEDGSAPVIEDDVEFGAYAQVLGNVRIGKGAKIGAMTVVLCDVPAGATAVGIPARIVPARPRQDKF